VANSVWLLTFLRTSQVDVTAAFRGEVVATQFSDERSMVRILDETRREEVLSAMTAKRERAVELFGASL
jgi:hypothetical protein